MQVKKMLSLIFSCIFLNVSCINTNAMDGQFKKEFLDKKRGEPDSSPDEEVGESLMTKMVQSHNSVSKEEYTIKEWGGWKTNQLFERFHYLLNPVAFTRSSVCSFNLYNDYVNNKWSKDESELWSIDKVRRQMYSGQDSDIESDYIDSDGNLLKKRGRMNLEPHKRRYLNFKIIYDNDQNFLAYMYKYIQTNRYLDDEANEANNIYYSSSVRKDFINDFDEMDKDDFFDKELYTPFGNLKVKRCSEQGYKKSGITLRNVNVYPRENKKGTFYSYNAIGNKFNPLTIDKKVEILELVNEYLCTEKDYDKCKEDWEKRVGDLDLKEEELEAFAVLCGMAVLAEPLRECDDGTSQRCVYRTMLYYLKKLRSKEISLDNDKGWDDLLKTLENQGNIKNKNLLKFYGIVKTQPNFNVKLNKRVRQKIRSNSIKRFFGY